MIKSVVRDHHWPPNIFGGFFIDDEDAEGLEFWYNDTLDMIKRTKPKKGTKS